MPEPMVPYSLYLPRDWWAQLDKKRKSVSRPEFLRGVIKASIDTKKGVLSDPRPIGRPKEN